MASLTDLLNKFIIEHGSAKIHKEHIALLKDQATLIEKDNSSLKTENVALKSENEQLKNETIELKKKLNTYEQSTHDIHLNEIEVKILVNLAKRESRTTKQISTKLNVAEAMITFCIVELKEKGMVNFQHVGTIGDCWSLEQKGRKYLVENGLLSNFIL
jgi:predicted RNase H-like nuclease (RuvC/YqgF family)